MLGSREVWCDISSFTCFSRPLSLKSMSGCAVDGKIWRFEEDWQRVEEEGNADEVGVSDLLIRMSREAGAHDSSEISGTEVFVRLPTLGGSMENGFGEVPAFCFASIFCTNMISFWSWRTKSCKVCQSSFPNSRFSWNCATVSCTECRFYTCFRCANGNFCNKGVFWWN